MKLLLCLRFSGANYFAYILIVHSLDIFANHATPIGDGGG